MCLKLIKNIETLDRLPVNHTIFAKMAEENKENTQDNGKTTSKQAPGTKTLEDKKPLFN